MCRILPNFCDGAAADIAADLRDAIKCSHYRCHADDGCKDGKIDELSWESDGGKVECSSFCPEEWRDEDGKICGYNADQYPVEIYHDGEGSLALSRDLNELNCFFDEETEIVLQGRRFTLPNPPRDPEEDWVVLINAKQE